MDWIWDSLYVAVIIINRRLNKTQFQGDKRLNIGIAHMIRGHKQQIWGVMRFKGHQRDTN